MLAEDELVRQAIVPLTSSALTDATFFVYWCSHLFILFLAKTTTTF
jgi:hypothetical protein